MASKHIQIIAQPVTHEQLCIFIGLPQKENCQGGRTNTPHSSPIGKLTPFIERERCNEGELSVKEIKMP